MESEDSALIYANGIDGTTGQYAIPPLDVAGVAALAQRTPLAPELRQWLQALYRKQKQGTFGLPHGVNPEDPTAAGWAIVFHPDEAPEVRKALQPLIEHRRKQIGAALVKELTYSTPNHRAWLIEQGVGAGTVDPTKVPYYLLIVGSPDRIPFDFSQRLNAEYATGRLHLPAPADYAAYVEHLVRYETEHAPTNAREVLFFAPRHAFDATTQLSADELIVPLAGLDASGKPTGGGFPERKQFRTRARLCRSTRPPWCRAPSHAGPTAPIFPSSRARPATFTRSCAIVWYRVRCSQSTV